MDGVNDADRSLERESMLALTLTEGLGAVGVGRLLARLSSARGVLEATASSWADALGCALARATRLRSRVSVAAARDEIDAGRRAGANLVVLGDASYPPLLALIPDPPPTLWVRGRFDDSDCWAVAVVGSRRASAYGLDQAARFATALAERGHSVVSGGARGIDAAAHRAALRAGGRTIAVLGSGLARPYPPEHAGLFDEIVEREGAVVSEFPVMMPPRSELFPRRNRIVAGLSVGVLVIEARRRSGASITARLAVEDHGREAMALPGRVDSPTSEGAHRAIREGWAALVASPDDVFEQLEPSHHLVRGAMGKGAPAIAPMPQLSPLGRHIAELLVRDGPLPREALFAKLENDFPTEVGAALAEVTVLEVRGLVQRDAAGRYLARPALTQVLQ